MSCPYGCPVPTGHAITDTARHTAWHLLVAEQGGPLGPVNAETLAAARGIALTRPTRRPTPTRRRRPT